MYFDTKNYLKSNRNYTAKYSKKKTIMNEKVINNQVLTLLFSYNSPKFL
jgi:hypothetical protein